MAEASRQDNYYQLETIFQEETANYLKKLKGIEFALQDRKKDYAINLSRRVDFVISILKADLISEPANNKK
jgi:hypothetical protein